MNWKVWRHNKRDMSKGCCCQRGFYRQNGPREAAKKAKLLEKLKARERERKKEEGQG